MFTTFKYELDHSCLIRIKLFTFYYQASQCHLTHYALPSISFQKPIFLCVFAQLIFACQWNFKGSFLVLKIVFKKLFEDRKHVNWPQVNIQFVLTSFHAILWRSMIKLVLSELPWYWAFITSSCFSNIRKNILDGLIFVYSSQLF